jgi:hypothetical protein
MRLILLLIFPPQSGAAFLITTWVRHPQAATPIFGLFQQQFPHQSL